MASPTPSIPPALDLNEALLKHTEKKFSDSYKWLMDQYDTRCKRLAEYAGREDHSQKYVLQETAFLTAFYKHLQALHQLQGYIKYLEAENTRVCNQNMQGDKFAGFLLSIIELHGIDLKRFLGAGSLDYVGALTKLAKATNSVILPDAFRASGNFPPSPFNLYTK